MARQALCGLLLILCVSSLLRMTDQAKIAAKITTVGEVVLPAMDVNTAQPLGWARNRTRRHTPLSLCCFCCSFCKKCGFCCRT
ncbi:uncharacterized protein LOC133347850 isoform X2 [Lethenteron reissneri]|uniref:uncharacterized protein LOC133347850 isoform X2 n=1 Tax=Lethenteron reissneri TaxID=7753 RepID=UPI002AB6B03F|nr:uncharacterized protein LOC133347850 isoform X2 [Lethenteron reissneri]